MSNSPSGSDVQPSSQGRLFGRKRNMHQILGGGKAAEILLWEDKYLSAAILMGITIIWFLFEVVGCHLITLLSRIAIIIMLILFFCSPVINLLLSHILMLTMALWAAELTGSVQRNEPPEDWDARVARETMEWLLRNIRWLLGKLYDISCGGDLKTFVLVIAFLWALSIVGSSLSFLTLFYTGSLSLMTLPAFYERYENEVNRLAFQARREIKRLFKKIYSKILGKISRGQ